MKQDSKSGMLRYGLAAVPLLAGGAFLLYRKLRHESPPAPAWDAELQPPPIQHEYRPEGDGPQQSNHGEVPRHVESLESPAGIEPVAEELPADRVEYTNEFGEKAVGLPGDGLDAVPATPVDDTELVQRFGGLIGRPIHDLMDAGVGSVEAVYYRQLRGEPEWAATSPGIVDKRRVIVPLDGATIGDDSIRLSVSKSMIDESPTIDAGTDIDGDLEQGLYSHYMVRRMLPGLEAERDEEGVRLRMWAPVATEMGDARTQPISEKEAS